jgi:membrane associated rhomboid family serine protease
MGFYFIGFFVQLFLTPLKEIFTLNPSIFDFSNSYTLLTHLFFEQNIFYLIVSLFFICLFGDNVEDNLSKVEYFLFFLVTGLIGSFGLLIFGFNTDVSVLTVAGSTMGIFGGFLAVYPNAKLKFYPYTVLYYFPDVMKRLGRDYFNIPVIAIMALYAFYEVRRLALYNEYSYMLIILSFSFFSGFLIMKYLMIGRTVQGVEEKVEF